MSSEIERKFLVKELPHLDATTSKVYERYFLETGPTEKRIQKVGDKYFYEEKSEISELERSRDQKKEISEEEFNNLKQGSEGPLIRERFDISSNPKISIQIYRNNFEGLVRAEVEFNSKEEATAFQPLPWMGKEITGLPIARDSALLGLSRDEFQKYL